MSLSFLGYNDLLGDVNQDFTFCSRSIANAGCSDQRDLKYKTTAFQRSLDGEVPLHDHRITYSKLPSDARMKIKEQLQTFLFR
jgi:hypothetical protein